MNQKQIEYGFKDLDGWNQKWGIKRAMAVSRFVRSSVKYGDKIKLLDIAGYKGDLQRFIQSTIDYHLIDLEENKSKNAVQWDLNIIPMPFEDKSFDMIVAVDIFEHVNNPYTFLDEIYRILKTDGIAVFGLSTRMIDGHKRVIKEDFFRAFKILERKGFIGGIMPFMQVPIPFASEIFYKVKKIG